MNYSENRKDLATILDVYRMREQARKDYEKGLQDLEENSMYSIEYKRELAEQARQEVEEKVRGYNQLATKTMEELINRVYNIPLAVDNDFTSLLTFIRACGDSLSKEQIAGLSEVYRGDMQRLKLIESVAKSSGVDVGTRFEQSFYFDESDKMGAGNVSSGFSKDEFISNWQNTVVRDDDSSFGYFFNETARKLGENIESPVHMQEFEAPPIL